MKWNATKNKKKSRGIVKNSKNYSHKVTLSIQVLLFPASQLITKEIK